MSVKFHQFQKNHTCLTSCLTTSGAPIGDMIVAFCKHSISMNTHETAGPGPTLNIIFYDSETELGAFVSPYIQSNVSAVSDSYVGDQYMFITILTDFRSMHAPGTASRQLLGTRRHYLLTFRSRLKTWLFELTLA